MLNGILKILADRDNPLSIELRRQYVFKIVPMLNPDGIYRGYYRVDTKGQNLNRYYTDPKLDSQPSIYAVKKTIEQQHELGKLKFYIDFHAHAGRRGCYMLGNRLYGQQQVDNVLFPKLISLNSTNFDFEP